MLGWLTPPRISVIKMFQTEAIREAYGTKHVAQDMLVPMTTLTDSMNCMDEEFAALHKSPDPNPTGVYPHIGNSSLVLALVKG